MLEKEHAIKGSCLAHLAVMIPSISMTDWSIRDTRPLISGQLVSEVSYSHYHTPGSPCQIPRVTLGVTEKP